MVKFNRRQFIALGAVGTGAALVGSWLRRDISDRSVTSAPVNSAPLYQSSNGLLELDLEASERLVNLGDRQANLLTYNGQIPAPRLEAKPGDKVRIHFTNNLEQPTNIHYHGLHIPITGNADNVFLKIEPGAKLTYEFQIPNNHPSGTFWYHPHLHGLVAEQLFGGLAGLFIVRGEGDEIPELKAAQEEFLVLQDFSIDDRGRRSDSAHMSLMMGREGEIITANGQVNPSISLTQNGLLCLRILNASPSRFYRLALEDHAFYHIATDGNNLNEPVEVDELLLTPGQRADILVRGEKESGQYRLLNLPYDRGSMGMMGGGMMGGRGMMGSNPDEAIALATVNYTSAVESVALPTKLNSIDLLPEPQTVRRFEINHGMTPGVGMAFLINGEYYQGDRADTQVKLNTVEDWELINTGVMDHPFHIHGNAFQVISRNGAAESLLAWRDTVLVKRGETVRIRIPFNDFTGKTVYHCHVLDHEDLGMMGNLIIEA
ncbi:Bilirubin oxidase (plasmid) [Stanieria cyanosphaera PCC 7437]|uniref:Bilirubin oxidase n=1 Tax=Stanieria cyanosphaera (strain ATCC 29371 / PCC 7437) TaxID=111780 RepID=K9Y0Q2_STAC7|nr:multicopper oxidase family protein [Stanieria cyanosphaera]AFZ37966.1 Bilirubin oxidase [Stanieria cyanosphaera PCC 7437]